MEEVTSERSLDGRIGVLQAQGTEKESGVKRPARAKASGRKPTLSAFLLGELFQLSQLSEALSCHEITPNPHPEHQFLDLYSQNGSESNSFHTVWPRERVESFLVKAQ